jgi:hypothetical protein
MTDRVRVLRRAAPGLLLAGVAVASLIPEPAWLSLATPNRGAGEAMAAAVDGLPDQPRVLVGFDPDLGTYAEVRPTVRVLLTELLARDARLDIVSLTAEGRALALAELARLARDGTDPASLRDLGFVAGAEAGLVDLAGASTDGLDAIVVVGGNDLGPRSWVEQVLPRVDDLALFAVTPTVLLPEVQPFLASGQLDAALVTPRDGAAYRAAASDVPEAGAGGVDAPGSLAIMVGMLVAIVVLGQALGAHAIGALRANRAREA